MNTVLRIATVLVALLPAAALASGFPVTVTSCGQPLTFDHAPQRAVINDINIAEMAFALQLQPVIVGLTGITGWYKTTPAFQALRGAIPELAPKYPALENLLAVHPDFFFAGWNYGMKVGGDVTPATLARYGIKTLVLSESCIHVDGQQPRASMALLYRDILTLGSIFGQRELAQQKVSEWQATLAEVAHRIGKRSPLPVFVYDSGEGKPFTSGKYAMPTAIIEAAGGRNILDNLPMSWSTVSRETVAASQPAFIILLDYQSSGSAATLRRFLESHPLMRVTPAVRQHRYLVLPYQALTPGPANIDAVRALARALYPDAFQ